MNTTARKKEKITSHVTINNKKHTYTLERKNKNEIYVECKDANLAQDFLAEDVANLILDLPNLIVAEKKYKENQTETVRFRISATDKSKIEKKALKEGYSSISEYLRNVALGYTKTP